MPPEQRKPSPSLVGEKMLTKKGVFGIVQGHANRHLAIDPKTGALFVGVGSSGNIGVEPEVKASIQRFDADGSNQTTYASGMRNPTALAFNPDTGDLYATVQERDGLGDNLVPDYFTHVQQGAFYGWPYSYIGQHPQPGFAQLRPDKVKAAIAPDVLFQAHSSAMDIAFYTGSQFPAEYKGDAFVALKGSWNRSEPTGYKVVRVPFKDGKPTGLVPELHDRVLDLAACIAPRCGAGPRRSPSPRTARCWSPTTPAARSGGSPTRERSRPRGRSSNRSRLVMPGVPARRVGCMPGHPDCSRARYRGSRLGRARLG